MKSALNKLRPRFKGFFDLTRHRINDILLVASLYDSFILEEDGQLVERIFSDYINLDISPPPRVTRVSSTEEALRSLDSRHFDLVVPMGRLGTSDMFQFGRDVKKKRPDLPVMLLTFKSPAMNEILSRADQTGVDRVFVWSGNSQIFLAMIKAVEDQLNARYDTAVGNVQVIIMVEDSPIHYSAVIPIIYSAVVRQTRALMDEGLNHADMLLRLRARPKILLATNHDEAIELIETYRNNLLSVISDVSFPLSVNGEKDPEAGFKLIEAVKEQAPDLPVLMQSVSQANAPRAYEMGACFLDKRSTTMLQDISEFFHNNCGFGDFVFRMPDGGEVGRASTLRDMEQMLTQIPADAIEYHASRNHFSHWLIARGEITLAQHVRPLKISDFETIDGLRQYLVESIANSREEKQRGVVAWFHRERFDPGNRFVRLGSGSLGGKGRGIAFLNSLIQQSSLNKLFPQVEVSVPWTVVIGTEVFDEFFSRPNLYQQLLVGEADQPIAQRCLSNPLSDGLMADLRVLLSNMHEPLAVRSSSLLEDSHFLPLAGLYRTYLLPNNHPDLAVRVEQLSRAIKLVYASTFFQGPKSYIQGYAQRVEEEKMAVIIQHLVGERHGDLFYPSFSGVAQSWNYYPLPPMEAADGVVTVALGLGRTVVEGERCLWFSPSFPRILPQFSDARTALDNTQREFYAVNMAKQQFALFGDDETTLAKLPLSVAEEHGTLHQLGGVVDQDDIIRDGVYRKGTRIVNFGHLLKDGEFPLAELMKMTLEIGKIGMGSDVLIEFAANLKPDDHGKSELGLLQIRPQVSGADSARTSFDYHRNDDTLCMSEKALGNGVISGIRDILFVRSDRFDKTKTRQIARDIQQFNQSIDRPLLLIGPGRWGTADRFLGIPVRWEQISNARVIVETNLDDFSVDPSFGAHFFHNVTSLQMGYLTVNARREQDFLDFGWLSESDAVAQTDWLRHIRLFHPLDIRLDGRTRRGIIQRIA